MQRITRALPTFFCLAALLIVPSLCRADDGFEGRWEGAILFKEGQIELDMVARLQQQPEGDWKAVVDLPVVGVVDHSTEDVRIEEDRIVLRFTLQGAEQTLTGSLDEDGKVIEGTFQRGEQPPVPVYLERRAAPEDRPDVELLSLSGPAELKERFNRDRGNVRLVLLLAPT